MKRLRPVKIIVPVKDALAFLLQGRQDFYVVPAAEGNGQKTPNIGYVIIVGKNGKYKTL
jgi:hypothetical protein